MTTADNVAQRPGAAGQGLLARYPLTFYFLIAYGFAWLVWVPLALSKDGAGFLSFRSPIGASRCGIRKTPFASIPLPQGGKDICAAGRTYQAMGEVRASAELLAWELSPGLV